MIKSLKNLSLISFIRLENPNDKNNLKNEIIKLSKKPYFPNYRTYVHEFNEEMGKAYEYNLLSMPSPTIQQMFEYEQQEQLRLINEKYVEEIKPILFNLKNQELLDILLENKLAFKFLDEALFSANNDLDLANYFIKKGAKLSLQDAMKTKNISFITLCVTNDAVEPEPQYYGFSETITDENSEIGVKVLKLLINKGYKPDYKSIKKDTIPELVDILILFEKETIILDQIYYRKELNYYLLDKLFSLLSYDNKNIYLNRYFNKAIKEDNKVLLDLIKTHA